MPARARVMPRAHGQQRKPAELPEARDVVLPELLAGCASAPVEWTRLFHRAFFDVADLAIRARGLLVLQDVVIGRPSPLLKEIQLWGSTHHSDHLARVSATDIGQLDLAPEAAGAGPFQPPRSGPRPGAHLSARSSTREVRRF